MHPQLCTYRCIFHQFYLISRPYNLRETRPFLVIQSVTLVYSNPSDLNHVIVPKTDGRRGLLGIQRIGQLSAAVMDPPLYRCHCSLVSQISFQMVENTGLCLLRLLCALGQLESGMKQEVGAFLQPCSSIEVAVRCRSYTIATLPIVYCIQWELRVFVPWRPESQPDSICIEMRLNFEFSFIALIAVMMASWPDRGPGPRLSSTCIKPSLYIGWKGYSCCFLPYLTLQRL